MGKSNSSSKCGISRLASVLDEFNRDCKEILKSTNSFETNLSNSHRSGIVYNLTEMSARIRLKKIRQILKNDALWRGKENFRPWFENLLTIPIDDGSAFDSVLVFSKGFIAIAEVSSDIGVVYK